MARRILIVDDDSTARRMIARWLASDGWIVDEAGDAAAADAKISAGGHDLVLLDFVLPDADGAEALRAWRQRGVAIPVVALTGASSETVVEEMLRAGAHDVVSKEGLTRESLANALAGAQGPPPFAPGAPRPRAPPELVRVTQSALPGRVLVVDDVETWRARVKLALEREGWRADVVATATDALQAALGARYDVIVTDWLLPDVDGEGFLQELRRRGDETPVVVLSAHGREGLTLDLLKAGAAAFLSKDGFTGAALLDAVAKARDAATPVRRRERDR